MKWFTWFTKEKVFTTNNKSVLATNLEEEYVTLFTDQNF